MHLKNTASRYFDADPNPSGLCLCGCGRPTTVATFNNAQTGLRKGHHRKYIRGHGHKAQIPDLICEQCGTAFRVKPSKVPGRRFCGPECARLGARGEEGLTPANIERFWTHVDRSGGPDACWRFNGSYDIHGYGYFSICQKKHRAHRISAELAYGPCPEDRRVCHHCDNPSCVNPRHLYYGTAKDNTQDAIRRGRWTPGQNALQGEVHPKARLTEAQVMDLRRRWVVQPFNMAAEARRLGITAQSVKSIIDQRNWKHLPSVEDLREEDHHAAPSS